MEESRCPLCGGKLDMTDATDWGRSVRGDALARIACVGCGLSLTAPAEAFDGARRALSGRGDRMTVQSIQRANPTGEVGEDGQPVVQQQAIVTTDGIGLDVSDEEAEACLRASTQKERREYARLDDEHRKGL